MKRLIGIAFLLVVASPIQAQEEGRMGILTAAVTAAMSHADETTAMDGRTSSPKLLILDQATLASVLGVPSNEFRGALSTRIDRPVEVASRDSAIACQKADLARGIRGACRVSGDGIFISLEKVKRVDDSSATVWLTYRVPTPVQPNAPMCPKRFRVELHLTRESVPASERVWAVQSLVRLNEC